VAGSKLFKDYLREKLFTPLGMSNTTADRQEILDNPERAVGHMMGMPKVPTVYPALGAVGIYSTARDMAQLVQLRLNRGILDGRRIVAQPLTETIHAAVTVSTDTNVYNGQGIRIEKHAPEKIETLLGQEGCGFGFLSLLCWYPECGVGTVVLTNKLPHPALGDLGLTLTDKLIKGKVIEKRFPWRAPDRHQCVGPWWGRPDHRPTPYKPEWRQYCGTHNLQFNEYKLEWWVHVAVLIRGRDEFMPRITVREKEGFLCVTESKFFQMVNVLRSVDQKLPEVRPGVFATKGGGTLDFARDVPTWCNYRLQKK
jgi:CubicO group peptidase (beta-lactamase class C family)